MGAALQRRQNAECLYDQWRVLWDYWKVMLSCQIFVLEPREFMS